MSDLPDIGMLWMRGPMSVVERLCIASFLDAGHRVKLYTYDEVPNIPNGVIHLDANDILPEETDLVHGKSGSPAPHADRWRYHLLSKSENLIWADTDAYCLKPFTTENGHFYGWESKRHVNVGVLGLPKDSATLARLIAFTNDIYAIPPWFARDEQARLQAARDAGQPEHAGDMVWGVWGPQALTHFLQETGEIAHALPIPVLYPIPFAERRKMVRPNIDLGHYITDETKSIHFYGRRIRPFIRSNYAGNPPVEGLFGRLMAKHGISPDPVTTETPPKPKHNFGEDAADLIANYPNEKQFLQIVTMPPEDVAVRPFVLMKNQGAGTGSAALISALMRKIAGDKGLVGDPKTNLRAVHSPPKSLLLTGARALDSKAAIRALRDPAVFRFAFLRHPVDHFAFGFDRQLNADPKRRAPFLAALGEDKDRDLSVDEVLTLFETRPETLMLHRSLRPQTQELAFDLIDYDFIGRFENAAQDYPLIATHLWGEIGALDRFEGEVAPPAPDIGLDDDLIARVKAIYAADMAAYARARTKRDAMVKAMQSALPVGMFLTQALDKSKAEANESAKTAEAPKKTEVAPKAPIKSAAETKTEWLASMQALGDEHGFFRQIGRQHSGLFVKRGKTLMITFENLDHVYEMSASKLPWGYAFVENEGWSILGMMAHDWTWYRDEAVYDFFDELRDSGFYDQFDQVVFYGASMGGYAAAAFSASCPGAKVILISPQATLEGARVDHFETRYKKARVRDFTTRYGYAPDSLPSASNAYLFFDPLSKLDKPHANMFAGDNLQVLHCPFFGHRIATLWLRLGILKKTILSCIDGSFDQREFYGDLRKRREDHRYQREMLDRLVKRGNNYWVAYYARAVLNRRGAPMFRRHMNAAVRRLGAAGRPYPNIDDPVARETVNQA